MPLTAKGNEILSNMIKEYGEEKGREVFYASKNARTITGVDSDLVGVNTSAGFDTPQLKRAAGILFVRGDRKILLMRRASGDHPGTWALPGGGVEEGETSEETARRETLEETGQEYSDELIPWTRRRADGVDFTTFVGSLPDGFEPTLNDEHDDYMWVDRQFALAAAPVLHPGLVIALKRFEMNELDIAKAIQAGELSSPQRYRNMMLVALRITGTGVAYRSAHEEFVWRDPSLYLNPEFLQRCQGLPVILEHPKKNLLDTKEYKDRNVGAVMLPYIQGDEVWGIARIQDMAAAEMIEEEQLSTSPGVLVSGTQTKLTLGGSDLLIEGKLSLLDHVAICPRGVWDKGGVPSGVDSVDAVPDTRMDAALSLLNDATMTSICRLLESV